MERGKSQSHTDSSEVVCSFREKSIQGTRADCSSWKVQRSLKFIFTSWAFQVDQRCLSLCDWFLGLPDDHIRWGGLCFMSLPYLLFSWGVLSSYLLCCLPLATQSSMGRNENSDLEFAGDATNFEQCSFASFTSLQKKIVPRSLWDLKKH